MEKRSGEGASGCGRKGRGGRSTGQARSAESFTHVVAVSNRNTTPHLGLRRVPVRGEGVKVVNSLNLKKFYQIPFHDYKDVRFGQSG